MRIKVVSDIHLEFGPMALDPGEADVLVAAGDIGVGPEGVVWLCQFDIPVVYVAGNHEFWGEDFRGYLHRVEALTAGSDLHFLENRAVVIGGVRFLGCTLWTDFNGGDAQLMQQMYWAMNDFRHIRHGDRGLWPTDLVEQNTASRKWLAEALEQPHDGPTVVVTHHAPSLKSWFPAKANEPMRYVYCNDMDAWIERYRPKLWVHGHVHRSVDYRIGGTRVLCNPRGYVGYQKVRGFDPDKIVIV